MANKKKDKRPLSDIMMAMDVVDTMRHQQLLVEQELNAEDRDRRMIERLREIYSSQGIEVPDNVLEQGVLALKEGRFVYTPPKKNFQTTLAKLYVNRSRWGKPLLLGLTAIIVVWVAYTLLITAPAERRIAALPKQLESNYQTLMTEAHGPQAQEQAQLLMSKGKSALNNNDFDSAQTVVEQMKNLQTEIDKEYQLRIVSRPGEATGLWRIPDVNSNARNYYIIVEAVTKDGKTLEILVKNEEDGKIYKVSKWGLRVDKNLFDVIAADKQDDGIIQNTLFGTKKRGYLKPEYIMPTSGGAITSW